MFASSSLTLTNNNMTTAQFIDAEFQRRVTLVENPEFVSKMAILAKEIGITANDWNENKIAILMLFANQYCSLENELI
jgi:hypothetical protein